MFKTFCHFILFEAILECVDLFVGALLDIKNCLISE